MKLSWKYVALFLVLYSGIAAAQVATGSYPYGTFDNQGPDIVNVANLDVHLGILVLHKAGRGIPFNYDLTFDNSIWYPVTSNGTTSWTPVQNFGWSGAVESATGYVSYSTYFVTDKQCSSTIDTAFTYHDSVGVQHSFAGLTTRYTAGCGTNTPSFTAKATDGSGYTLYVTNYNSVALSKTKGGQFYPPTHPNGATGSIIDPNGNVISTDGNGHFTDTTGKVALTVAGTPSGTNWTQTFTYTDTSGNPQEVKVNYTQKTVATHFGCSGITEFPATAEYLISSIVLGDGVSTYSFTYEKLSSGYYTGRLNTVTLPQGGVITYTYPGANGGVECADGSTNEVERVIAANSGSAASTWTYTRTQPNGTGTSHTEVVDGLTNYKEYDFVMPATSTQYAVAPGTYYETNRQIYQGAKTGTPFLAQSTCYNANTTSCLTTQPSLPLSQIDAYSTLNGTEADGSTLKYDTYGDLTESDAYDFGSSGSRGSLLRKEAWAYGYSLPGLPTTDTIYDGSGNTTARTAYQYDQTTPTASSGVPQHVSVTGPRGNLTTETLYSNSSTTYTITNTYEDTGSLLTSIFKSGATYSGTTTVTYDSTFVYLENESLPTPSSGVAISNSATYDTSYTGLPFKSIDPNSQATQITSYDAMLRPLEATYPDGGYTTYHYWYPDSEGIYTYQNSSVHSDTEFLWDGYGRPARTAIANGQSSSPWYQQDTCYDADGNVGFVSYNYLGTGFGSNPTCSGSGGDTFTYDVMGRPLGVQHGDGTSAYYSYNGRATKFTDENSVVARITQVDGLGRPTIVCEIYSGSPLNGNSGSPASCGTDIAGTGYATTYAYSYDTTSGNTLTTVTQGSGIQTRTFQADWLGRTTKVIEPESGTATYGYTYASTGLQVTRTRPKANQTGSSTTTTTTQYDSLNRPVSISYSDGTPTKSYYYDLSSAWSATLQNSKGRLSEQVAGNTGSVYSYDPMGRAVLMVECTPSTCGTTGFVLTASYDWEGNMTQYVDAFGPTYTYSYTPANEQKSITSNWNNSNDPADLLSNVSFGPAGPLSWTLGNGDTAFRSYDTLNRVSGGSACKNSSQSSCSGGTTIHSFTNGWTGSYLTSANDSILGQNDSYSYDAFGRLSSATVNGTQNARTYSYDRWGNRWTQTGNGPQPNLSFNTATNQVSGSGYSYDAAGDMTNDGVHSYTYDAEGNVTQVDGGQTATYTYDALNRRVRIDNGSSSSFEFIFDPQGRHSSEYYVQGQYEQEGWTYWGAAPISFYTNATTQFEHQDWEGTERARTDVNGNSAGTYFSLPFGDGYSYTGDDWNPYHFGTLDQDNSANDHAQFREYSNMAGRWFSPDPYQGSYDPNNPQSFNRYAYALNNPASFLDPSGLNVGHPCAGSPQCNNGDTNNPFEPGSGTGLSGLFSFTYITATWVPGQETNGPYIPGYWVYGTAVETFAFNNGPSGPFSPGGGAPNNAQECDNACQLAHAFNKTGVYSLTSVCFPVTFYAASGTVAAGGVAAANAQAIGQAALENAPTLGAKVLQWASRWFPTGALTATTAMLSGAADKVCSAH